MNVKSFVKHTVRFLTVELEKLIEQDTTSKDIELLTSNIKTKVSSPHFKSITDVIYKSKEKLFKKAMSGKKV